MKRFIRFLPCLALLLFALPSAAEEFSIAHENGAYNKQYLRCVNTTGADNPAKWSNAVSGTCSTVKDVQSGEGSTIWGAMIGGPSADIVRSGNVFFLPATTTEIVSATLYARIGPKTGTDDLGLVALNTSSHDGQLVDSDYDTVSSLELAPRTDGSSATLAWPLNSFGIAYLNAHIGDTAEFSIRFAGDLDNTVPVGDQNYTATEDVWLVYDDGSLPSISVTIDATVVEGSNKIYWEGQIVPNGSDLLLENEYVISTRVTATGPFGERYSWGSPQHLLSPLSGCSGTLSTILVEESATGTFQSGICQGTNGGIAVTTNPNPTTISYANGLWSFTIEWKSNLRTASASAAVSMSLEDNPANPPNYGELPEGEAPPIITFGPLDICTDEADGFGCFLGDVVNGLNGLFPFSWGAQIYNAYAAAASGTAETINLSIDATSIAGGIEIELFDSTSSSPLVAGLYEAWPEYYSWLRTFIWVSLIPWAWWRMRKMTQTTTVV